MREIFKKSAVTVLMFLVLGLGGKLLSIQSADATNAAVAIETTNTNTFQDVLESQFDKVEPIETRQLHQKRQRVWSDLKHDRWCHENFIGYSSRSGKYISENGKRVLCHSPYTKSKSKA